MCWQITAIRLSEHTSNKNNLTGIKLMVLTNDELKKIYFGAYEFGETKDGYNLADAIRAIGF